MVFECRGDIHIVQLFSSGTHAPDGWMTEERTPIWNILLPEPSLHNATDTVEKEKGRFNHIRKRPRDHTAFGGRSQAPKR